MIKITIIVAIAIFVTVNSTSSATRYDKINPSECNILYSSMRNHIETIYLVQMAEFFSTRTRSVESSPELSNGIADAFAEIVEALGHYDGARTRHAIDVILKLCPL